MSTLDFAIIGGGVSGTYCAWRLKKKFPDKNIILFEYSDRIGGRLLSVEIPGVDVKAELGGMRYNPKQHKLFDKLVKDLNLKSREFPMGPTSDPAGDNNLAYIRGQHAKIKELSDILDSTFSVNWSERGKTPDELQRQVLETLVPGFQDLTEPKQIGEAKVFEKELWQYGFWNLLFRVLSPEAYEYLKYGSGYDTNVSNGNAAVLLPTGSDYTPSDDDGGSKFWTLNEGLDILPKTLEKKFREEEKGDVRMKHRLHSIIFPSIIIYVVNNFCKICFSVSRK